MSSHKKKKYESDSSSSDNNDSSSSEEKSYKKSAKKHKASSDDSDSNDSDYKSRSRKSKRSEEREVTYKHKKADYDTKSRSSDTSRNKDDRNQGDRYKKQSYHRDKVDKRDYEEREKYNKDKRDDRGSNRDRYNQRDKYDNRGRYDNRDRNRNDKDKSRGFEGYKRDQEDRYKRNDNRRRSSSFDHANAKWGKPENELKSEKKEPVQKEKPNFGLSGKLTEETNTYRGVVIKYSEPPEARKPRRRWRLYPFKGEKALQTLYIHRQSAYLIGRERKIVDLPVDHPSCSKQHAAFQYRLVPFTRENGSIGKRVRPYIIDLESANGTFINDKKLEPKKYYELFEKDVLKFGYSSREYVLLHENSKDEALDDDVKMEEDDEVEVKVKKEHS